MQPRSGSFFRSAQPLDSATTKPSAAAKVLKQPANLKPDQCSGSTGIQTPQAKSGEIRISAGMMFQLSQVLDINLPSRKISY